ncbi:hypothetical protein SAMN05661012_04043 [Chitinophaga sancti]|uniref:Uncharacterized protein n=1 Tax=Chitinophaga sancti TaxID=1004 RepID=A0A1K1RP88_9BACT|nr:hypothetical protein SAMN05661012_04043 [Chitinophaga sancti]
MTIGAGSSFIEGKQIMGIIVIQIENFLLNIFFFDVIAHMDEGLSFKCVYAIDVLYPFYNTTSALL